jgi:hypothetical protein
MLLRGQEAVDHKHVVGGCCDSARTVRFTTPTTVRSHFVTGLIERTGLNDYPDISLLI